MKLRRFSISLLIFSLVIGSSVVLASTPSEITKLLASDGASGDYFGIPIAMDGDTAIIGGYNDDGQTGAAYVFIKDTLGNWIEQAKLTASDAGYSHNFGVAIDIEGDTAVIGAHRHGAAYIFERDANGVWTETALLTASDNAYTGYFGVSTSIQGNMVAIGAHTANSVYVFTKDASGNWSEQAKLQPADGHGGYFGLTNALDNNTLIVGAYNSSVYGSSAGAAYIFNNDGIGNWTQTARIASSDIAPGDAFGLTVSLEGDTAVIGAHADDHAGGVDAGSAYVFVRDINGVWSQHAKLTASDAASDDIFGAPVYIKDNTITVGAPQDDTAAGADAGSVYIFTQDTSGSWSEYAKVTASDAAAGDTYGRFFASEGDTLIVGSYADDDLGSSSGSAYVYSMGIVANLDADADGILDISDNCPNTVNADQTDSDGDGMGDACDTDDDNDIVLDTVDNCPFNVNADQADLDGDGLGDVCDADPDGDGIVAGDNCSMTPNPFQTDTDLDGSGDACDHDDDNDSILDDVDNCPTVVNLDQSDLDGDGIGDTCDTDIDGDGTNNEADNCPLTQNVGQDDTDSDGQGDGCDLDDDNDGYLDAADNCPLVFNDQSDQDNDGKGDSCDADIDGDGVANEVDNCPTTANSNQNDLDGDGLGDACDPDIDSDGVANASDICPTTPPGTIVDTNSGCSIAQLCPCDGPRGTNVNWRNHGKYVSCTAKTSENFVSMGLITDTEKDTIVSEAANSTCGSKK